MRLLSILPLGLLLVACASSPEEEAALTEPPNPLIGERIEARLAEAREASAPDLHDVPSEGPALPTKAELQAERAEILAQQAALRAKINDDRLTPEEEALLRRAERLLAQIERDRAQMKAEGLLSQNRPVLPSVSPSKPPQDETQ